MNLPGITLHIPGSAPLVLHTLLLDYNGTLAKDGIPVPGVMERLDSLSRLLSIEVITADTFGSVQAVFHDTPVNVHLIEKENQDRAKLRRLHELGATGTAAMGNGVNDRLMLADAAFSVGVLGDEGASFATLQASRIVVRHICDGLDLLLHPLRCAATLRN